MPTPSDQTFSDDHLVYVDPETKMVIGLVEYTADGYPKSLPYKGEGEKSWRKFFPWGTYRSMKRAFRLEGKVREERSQETLEEVLPRALNDEL